MKSSGLSSLILGTALASATFGFALAEDAGESRFGRDTVAATVSAGADVDVTASIAPLAERSGHAGLSPLAPRDPSPLRALEPKPAPTAPAAHTTAVDPAAETIRKTTSEAPASLDEHRPAEAAPVAPVAPPPAATEIRPTETAPATSEAKPAEPAPVASEAAPAAPVSTPTAEAETTHREPADTTSLIDAVAATLPVPEPLDPRAEPAATAASPAPEDRTGTAPSTAAVVPAAPEAAPKAEAAAPAAPAAAAPVSTEAAVAAALDDQLVAEAMEKASTQIVAKGGASYERAERAALVEFYRARGWRPFFVGAQDLTREGRALAAALADGDRDGLDPSDYAALPQRRLETPEARANAEYLAGETALRFVRHLASGRFEPSRVSDLVTPRPPRPDPAVVLHGFAESRDLAATIAEWAPPQEGYRRLKATLADLRAQTETPVVRVPAGPLLSPGQKDERVALLRERMGLAATASDADPETYDGALAEAVKAFQRERGIAANGKVGRSTIAALNEESRGSAGLVTDVIVNMERWRWLPRDLGELHVFVNIPDFHLDVMKNGKSIHHARVITGRPENPTPIFSETMEYVVVNPYWNVPYSIVKKEMMDRLQTGRLGGSFEVEVGNRRVDPGSVDWTAVGPEHVSIRQRPGDGNALGNIKFMFPNQHSVYIHDTSSRSLFARDYRALSHGCVRVHEPFSFADAVLSEEPDGLDGARLKKLVGRAEQQINLKRHIPVHIAYFTEFVDETGHLQSRRDVYGIDAKIRRILGL